MTGQAVLASLVSQATAFGGPHGWDGAPFPLFLIPLLWILVLAAVAAALILGRRRRERLTGRLAGERVLAERFAAGEIDEDEYRARRTVLRTRE